MTISRFKKDILLWGILIALFLVTRLVNLSAIPIFTDEAIYLHWSQAIAGDFSKFLYLPLTDGKPPLFMWATAAAIKVLPALDPLYIGRLVSVASGLLALVGIVFTSYQFFRDKKTSYLAALLYVLTPFTFFYDRFGLVDSMLAMWGIWSLGLGLVLVRTLRLGTAFLLGIIVGLGLLTKTPALFFLVFLLPLVVFFNFKDRNWKTNLVRLGLLYLIIFVVSRLLYSILLFLPQAYVISIKNQEFIVSFPEFVSNPLRLFIGNARALVNWETSYLTVPLLLALLWGILDQPTRYLRQKIVLLGCFAAYFLFLSLINKVIYPRYLLLFTPLLLILTALGINRIFERLGNRVLIAVAAIGLFLFPLYTDYKLLTDPASAPIADNDSEQYLNSWPAGWGINSMRAFFKEQSGKSDEMTLGVEGTFGLMPYALDIYHREFPNLEIKPYWPAPGTLPVDINKAAADHPTYYLIYQRDKIPIGGGKLELIAKYRQGYGSDFLKLYKVTPEQLK